MSFLFRAVFATLCTLGLCISASSVLDFDPYVVLGVGRRSSTAQIKAAYRQKAKDTHPDKNPGVDPDVSADLFRKVVEAFEVLSDDKARKKYDQQHDVRKRRERAFAQQQMNRKRRAEKQRRQQEENEKKNRARMKNSPGVRQAQSRVIRVTSLDQLQTIMLDKNGRLERNLLMAFVGNKRVEQIVDDVLLFPFPFAGMGKNNVWWDDMLQSVKVRYNKQSDLTRFFRVPTNERMTVVDKPFIIFVRKGDRLNHFRTYSDKGGWNKRDHLEMWVQSQLQTTATIINRHHHKIELFLMDSGRSVLVATIAPGSTHMYKTASVGQEFLARDWRVDKFPGGARDRRISEKSALGRYKVDSHNPRFVVTTSDCVDMSGHCAEWARSSSCQLMPEFMHSVCASTCGVCNDGSASLLSFLKRYVPASIISPSEWLEHLRSTMPIFIDDLAHIFALRKNAGCTFAFLGLGFGLGLAALIWQKRVRSLRCKSLRCFEMCALLLLVVFPSCCIISSLILVIPSRSTTQGNILMDFMRVYALDVRHVMRFRKNAAATVLFVFVLVGLAVGSSASVMRNGKQTMAQSGRGAGTPYAAAFAAFWCLFAVLIQICYVMSNVAESAAFMTDIEHVLAFRKNAALTIAALGLGLGLRIMLFAGGLRWKYSSERSFFAAVVKIAEVAFVCLPLFSFFLTSLLGEHYGKNWKESSAWKFMRVYKADIMHIAALRKNAAAALFILSFLLGLMLGVTIILTELVEIKQNAKRARQKVKTA